MKHPDALTHISNQVKDRFQLLPVIHCPDEKPSCFCSGALLLLRFLWFSGLYFPFLICVPPSLKAQFVVEKLGGWMPHVPYKAELEEKVSIARAGGSSPGS